MERRSRRLDSIPQESYRRCKEPRRRRLAYLPDLTTNQRGAADKTFRWSRCDRKLT